MSDHDTPPPARVRRARRRPYHPLPAQAPPEPVTPVVVSGLAPAVPDPAGSARRIRAEALVRRFALLGGGMAAIPVPVVDALAVGAVHIRLIQSLARLYEVPFQRERGRAALVGLMMGAEVGVVSLSVARFIPGLGYLAVAGPGAALFAALGYAVGRVFIQHFEAGGTLLDFDPTLMRAHFQRELAMARRRRRRTAD